jgi:hypothetical protein
MEMGNCKGVNYEKRKNNDLFKTLEKEDSLFLSNPQNYSPIYKRFFLLNETNYNHINLNHDWHLNSIKENNPENKNIYKCIIQNSKTNKVKNKNVFFKLAPLIDPFKYLIGKYNPDDPKLFNLPQIATNIDNNTFNSKFLDVNNSSYVVPIFITVPCHQDQFNPS